MSRTPTLFDHRGKPLASYKAAEFSRLTAHLPSVCRPTKDELTTSVLTVLMARSRFVYKNHAHCHGAIDLIMRRVASGLKIQARLRGRDGAFLRDECRALEDLWSQWAMGGLSTRAHKEKAFFKVLTASRIIDGEVFLIRREDPRRHPITRAWQVVTGDYLVQNWVSGLKGVEAGNTVVCGIEEDANGRPVAYHFYDDGESGMNYAKTGRQTVRIPAENVLHWYSPTNPDQRRGIPLLTPVILRGADLDEYISAALTQAWGQACTTAFIKTPMAAESIEGRITLDDQEPQSTPERWREDLVPGVKEYLLPGEDVVYADPKSPGGNFDPFTKAILRAIACGIGISYESLARDYSQVNYSSIRQGQLDDRMTYDDFAQEMDEEVIVPIWRDFVDHAYILNRALPMPAQARSPYDHYIQHPKQGWVDPLKEVQASGEAVDRGFTSPQRVCAEKGDDYYEIIDEIAEARRYAEDAGVTLNASPAGAKGLVLGTEDEEKLMKILEVAP